MDGHVRISLGNVAVITAIAVLGVGVTKILVNYLKDQQIPVISHLAVGGDTFLDGKVSQ